MLIRIASHNFSIVEDPTSEIQRLLSYTTKAYNPRFKRWKVSQTCLINNQGMFYTGLVPYVQEFIPEVQIVDERRFEDPPYHSPNLSITLRDYQLDYVFNALKERRLVCHSSVASGKTAMMAAIISILKTPTLIMVPDLTIQNQLYTELAKLLPGLYEYTIGIPRNLIKKSTEALQQYKLLLVDECHTIAADQATDVILRNNAHYRIGFTGTPTGRSDNKDLIIQGLLGRISQYIEVDELVAKGYLAETSTDIYYASWEGDYALLEQLLIVQNHRRNELIQKILANHKGKTCLVLIRRIEHGELLQKMIPNSVLINGSVDGSTREDVREQVKKGKIKILIASNVFSTGLDIPNLDVVINAGGGKSEILTGQKRGRVQRPYEGKCKKMIDIFDDWTKTLEMHSRERIRIYNNTGTPANLIGFPPNKERSIESD